MEWKDRLTSEYSTVILTAQTLGNAGILASQADLLFADQSRVWDGLRQGLSGLSASETRTIQLTGGRVVLQYNPQRIVSTSASIDSRAICARPCFLCPGNMPEEERGIGFLGRYAILCNPFPVLPSHLVIAALEHRPQRIEAHFEDMLGIAHALGPDYAVFYNGPACGASAPDHMHFQAAYKKRLPIVTEVSRESRRWMKWERAERQVVAWRLLGYRVNFVAAQSARADALVDWFNRLMRALGKVAPVSEPEPMINLMAEYTAEGRFKLVVFPRERHRPSAYFAEGDDKLTISPAAIDLAGVLVTPVESDFRRLTDEIVAAIYREVTSAPAWFDRLFAEMEPVRRGGQ